MCFINEVCCYLFHKTFYCVTHCTILFNSYDLKNVLANDDIRAIKNVYKTMN